MSLRLSTGAVNKLMGYGSFQDVFANSVIDVYSSTQPTTPDNVPNGTLLVSVTKSSGAYTAETRATGTVTVTGSSGSFSTVTVNGLDILGASVPYNTSTTQTAADLAAQINRNPKNLLFVASSSGAVCTLTALNGLGTLPNTWVVTASTSCSATYGNMAGGVDAVNGLRFDVATDGAISKVVADTWSGVPGASGTAGWFRMRESGDTGTGSSTTAARADGTIATSGADMNLGSTVITAPAPFILSAATFTLPKQ